jgi:hypothetical protein
VGWRYRRLFEDCGYDRQETKVEDIDERDIILGPIIILKNREQLLELIGRTLVACAPHDEPPQRGGLVGVIA